MTAYHTNVLVGSHVETERATAARIDVAFNISHSRKVGKVFAPNSSGACLVVWLFGWQVRAVRQSEPSQEAGTLKPALSTDKVKDGAKRLVAGIVTSL